MTWNPTTELAKRAAVIAKEENGGSFNKAQLIDASEKVFDGYGANPLKPIKTMEDVGNAGNAMAFIDGHYPAGMSGCFVVGINGGCGFSCPVFNEGVCDEPSGFELADYMEADEYDESVALSYWNEDEIAEAKGEAI